MNRGYKTCQFCILSEVLLLQMITILGAELRKCLVKVTMIMLEIAQRHLV